MKQKKVNKTAMLAKKIDINSIYIQLKKTINERVALQKAQDDLWLIIKSHHCNRSAQMSQITKKIGNCTHKLNQLINELCQFKKTHKAMNLAHDYIIKEIARIDKIIKYQQTNIRKVNSGQNCLISSNGVVTTNTHTLENYVNQKQVQLARLKKWKNSIEKYLVK